jgi:hypothetical protein
LVSDGQRTTKTRQGHVTIFASCEEILKEKKSFSRQTSVFDIFEPSSWTLASPRVLFGTGVNDPDNPPTLQEQEPRP